MSTLSASLFTSSSATQAQWKSVAGKSSDAAATAVFQPKQAAGDSVSVSKLGQALKGVAADVFSLLDKKGKETLNSIVDNGLMSAEDVALGLRSAATNGLFGRYINERPKDSEDVANAEKNAQAKSDLMKKVSGIGEARSDLNSHVAKAMESLGKGEIDTEGFQSLLEAPMSDFNKKLDGFSENGQDDDMGVRIDHAIRKNIDGFNQVTSQLKGENGLLQRGDEAGAEKSAEVGARLFQLFKGMSGEKSDNSGALEKAISAFADSVELPGIGRKGASLAELQAANGDSSGKAAAAPANPAAQALSQAQTAAATAAPATKTATAAAADPGKGKSAVSLLQSAIDANAKAHQPAVAAVAASSDKADAGLSSLLDALKSGAKPASPNVKIDT
jgi:hypothetical protein